VRPKLWVQIGQTWRLDPGVLGVKRVDEEGETASANEFVVDISGLRGWYNGLRRRFGRGRGKESDGDSGPRPPGELKRKLAGLIG
jgi:hypothetical protein